MLGHLPEEAVLGSLVGDGAVERFQPNPAFIALLHDTIRRVLPLDTGFQRAAAEQGDGWLYVIDLRTPEGPQGNVPPEDIISGFEVNAGKINAEKYYANDKYLAWTRNGVPRLPPSLSGALLQAIKERALPTPARGG
ncbi:MAG: hypothetical protein JOY64_24525 [Alphaproteobacteria bacterium]|nr:hypothetical protein [Alphaproteobacteria bacterium]